MTIGQVCVKLEYLNLEEVTHLSPDSLASLIVARKETLKTLLMDGEYYTDEFYRHLSKLKRIESLGVAFADSIASQGMEAIADLGRLTSLKLMRAKELPPIDFVTTFSSPKMSKLTVLNLSECCLLDDNSLAAVAATCRLLRVIKLEYCLGEALDAFPLPIQLSWVRIWVPAKHHDKSVLEQSFKRELHY